jgi:hypothetical protein
MALSDLGFGRLLQLNSTLEAFDELIDGVLAQVGVTAEDHGPVTASQYAAFLPLQKFWSRMQADREHIKTMVRGGGKVTKPVAQRTRKVLERRAKKQ